MITEEQLRQLYDTELRATLRGIEWRRWEIKLLVPIGTVAFFAIFYYNFHYDFFSLHSIIPLLIFAGSAVWGAYRFHLYRKIFKGVAEKIIHLINPEWVFEPNKFVWREHLEESDLMRRRFFVYDGDNLITGTMGNTIFECSEFTMDHREMVNGRRGKVRIFQGLLMKMDFETAFAGHTCIIDKVAYDEIEEFADKTLVQNLRYPVEPSLWHNHETSISSFNEYFVVQTSADEESVINPELMHTLLKIREVFDKEIRLSFVGKSAYCVIRLENYQDLFEPRVYKTGVSYQNIKAMYNIVRLIEAVALMLSKYAKA